MFCPMCGAELILVIRKENEIDFDESEWYTKNDFNTDESEWYKCNRCNCFGDDFPLVLHHPLGGMESRPGDSWSLTWLK